MKTIISFSKQGKEKLWNWVLARGRNAESWNKNETLIEAFNRVSDRIEGEHEPVYELRGRHTKSGNPETFDFVESDFEYLEDDLVVQQNREIVQLLAQISKSFFRASSTERKELKREVETFIENLQASFKCFN